MHSQIKGLHQRAQEHYLNLEEIKLFKDYTFSLAQRLETYELLRDQEVTFFQPVADELVKNFPQKHQEIERSLKHWLSVLRYCAMAMLLNNHEFLQYRLLEWLTDIVQVQQNQEIDHSLYQLLHIVLQETLPEKKLALLEPFLAQAKTTLLGTNDLVPLQI